MRNPGKYWIVVLFLILISQTNWAFAGGMPVDSVVKSVVQPVNKGYHVVQKGDTYYSLSRLYKIPVDTLKKWNGESLPLGHTVRVMAKPEVKTAVKPVSAPAANLTVAAPPTVAKPAPRATAAAPKPAPGSTTLKQYDETDKYAPSKKEAQRVLVVPFDPYLYFSDADNDISLQSKIPRQNVRYVFRHRLNAFIDPKGFESINLLGGVFRDSTDEINKIYKALAYSYQDIKLSKHNPQPEDKKATPTSASTWIQKQKEKLNTPAPGPQKAPSIAQDETKYYGVKVKDPNLYTYFNKHYAVDYYLFINQFEIKTDYTSCLDRTTQNFVRDFVVHYSIYNSKGELVAGNKVKIPYVSNMNNIDIIVRENLSKMAQRILGDLPRAQEISTTAAQAR